MTLHHTAPLGALLALGGAILILVTRQGTLSGALAGFAVALLAALGLGAGALLPLAIFVLGSGLLTRIGRARKERLGAAEGNRGRRGPAHVAAKLSLPALAALGARGGHFGRNVILSLASATLALSARALGWTGS